MPADWRDLPVHGVPETTEGGWIHSRIESAIIVQRHDHLPFALWTDARRALGGGARPRAIARCRPTHGFCRAPPRSHNRQVRPVAVPPLAAGRSSGDPATR